MSIPTSGIGSDRYSSTSRELDSSERRSLNSSPRDVHKPRQKVGPSRHYSTNNVNQRQFDRNCNQGNINNGHMLQGATRSAVVNNTSAKQIPPSKLHPSPNPKPNSGMSSASPILLDKNTAIMTKSVPSYNDSSASQSKFSSPSPQSDSSRSVTFPASITSNTTNRHQSKFSSPSSQSDSSRSVTFPTSITSDTPNRHQASVQQSRWQKLFSSFKKSKNGGVSHSSAHSHGSGPAHSEDAFSLKHSHNCSNSFLKAGISNMKGYKKANQDRLV